MGRIHLSPPHMTETERALLLEAFEGNWIAPVGPDLTAFEEEFARRVGVAHAVALSSGSAGLHLALLIAGVQPGDVVIVPSFTFAATANAACYVGAEPWLVDSTPASWNVDPDLVSEAVQTAHREGRRVGAVVTVDLYGQCAEHPPIRSLCDEHGIALVEDAAEAVGATWHGQPAGSFGDIGVFSFNGNKLMTTGGGGMLVSADPDLVARARHLATQARQPVLHYEHEEVGYNYRLSNVLAAIGRGQLHRLDEMLQRRATIRRTYEQALGDLPGVAFNPLDPRGEPNHWLTVAVLDDRAAADPFSLIAALEKADAEARPAWKPMHLQPLFADARRFGGAVAEAAFAHGVCLPSGKRNDRRRTRPGRRCRRRRAHAVNARLRVRHLLKGLGPGGAERLVVAQALAGGDIDHDVVYLLPWKDHLVPRLTEAGVAVHCVETPSVARPGWIMRLRRLLRNDPTDIVHIHSPAVAALTRLLIRTLPRSVRPAVVTTEHNRWPRHHRLTRLANRATIRLDDAVIPVSDDVRSTIRGPAGERVHTIIHGIDLDGVRASADREAVRAELGAAPDDIVVACVANLRREKALDNWSRPPGRALQNSRRFATSWWARGRSRTTSRNG